MFTISAAQNIVNIYSHSCVYRNGTEKIVVVVVMKKSYMKKGRFYSLEFCAKYFIVDKKCMCNQHMLCLVMN